MPSFERSLEEEQTFNHHHIYNALCPLLLPLDPLRICCVPSHFRRIIPFESTGMEFCGALYLIPIFKESRYIFPNVVFCVFEKPIVLVCPRRRPLKTNPPRPLPSLFWAAGQDF